MKHHVRGRLGVGLLVLVTVLAVIGCRREKPIPPPTPQQVQAGLEKTAERIRNDPKLTPEQKEAAIRGLYGMAAGIKTTGEDKR